MNKKIKTLIILTLVMTIMIACNANPNVSGISSVIDNDEKKVKLSAGELCELYNTDKEKFKEKYEDAAVTVLGTVEKVEVDGVLFFGGVAYRIDLKEGFQVYVIKKDHPEVAELKNGDSVEITSRIQYCGDENMVKLQYLMIEMTGDFVDKTIIEKK